jgi:hypothetical protein
VEQLGGELAQATRLCCANAILDAGVRAMPNVEKGQLPACGVGDERLVAPAVAFFEHGQLCAVVWAFTTNDHPYRLGQHSRLSMPVISEMSAPS